MLAVAMREGREQNFATDADRGRRDNPVRCRLGLRADGNDLRGAQMPLNLALLSTVWNARSIERALSNMRQQRSWRRMTELGTRQSRPATGRKPDRPRPGPRRSDAAADVARARARFITVTNSAWYRCRLRRNRCAIPSRRESPGIDVGRDGCRTPMQWDAFGNAAFRPCSRGYRCRSISRTKTS